MTLHIFSTSKSTGTLSWATVVLSFSTSLVFVDIKLVKLVASDVMAMHQSCALPPHGVDL